MHIFKVPSELNNYIKQLKKEGLSLGLVPTMGALHEGHLSIIRKSISENDFTIASIFVNPIQFNNPSDLQAYPRPIENDVSLLKDLGCSAVFIPDVSDIYANPPIVTIDFGPMGSVMEGKFRPGHFSGVSIIVSKLLHMIFPDKVYFGLKDLQQVTIIKRLVADLSFPVKIVECETLREADGLALSSRNVRIAHEKRDIAPYLFKALKLAEGVLKSLSVSEVISNTVEYLNSIPDIKLEYFEIVDSETLMEVHDVRSHSKIALCIAAYLGEVRLIDNIIVTL
ncbi:MAG TPA: pantoate--beta-alanine ligase [Cytophagaceae bacterium]|jgi:pantoate--beta-alanine ligase